jgi:uncharacterized protein (TIGR02145 family)
MKRHLSLFAFIILSIGIFAQAPQKLSYQAIIRDSDNNLLKEQSVGVQISIIQGDISGSPVYVETHSVTTNINGLISLHIGDGTVVSGNILTIDWTNGPYFIQTETDPTGGTNYTLSTKGELLSVPYALHANTAEKLTGELDEQDPGFKNSVAYEITEADISNWNNKLSNYTETDPVYSKSIASSITANDKVNWNNKSEFSGSYEDLTNRPNLAFSNDTIFLGDNNFVALPYSKELVISLSGQNLSCYESNDGSINSTTSGGRPPYTYLWSNGESTPYLLNLEEGTYSVIVTDQLGNTTTNSIHLSQPDSLYTTIQKENPTCYGYSNGTISLNITGGASPYTVQWSNGRLGSSISNISAADYSFTIYDQNNCQLSDLVTLTSPSEISIVESLTNVKCYNVPTGEIQLEITGGTAPYNISWSGTSKTSTHITGLSASTYTANVTDANTCLQSETYTLTQNSQLLVASSVKNNSCVDQNTGSIALTITGGVEPYTYLWNTGATSSTITDVNVGSYDAIITDSEGCTLAYASNISNYTDFTISAGVFEVVNNTNDGWINLTVDGTGSFTYNWSNGATTEDINGLSPDTYTVEVTDENSCSHDTSYIVENLTNVTDVEGNTYNIVRIGEDIWMAENYKVTHFGDGWLFADYKFPGNDESLVPTYGLLYPGNIVAEQDFCPSGWHVPTYDDVNTMTILLRGDELAGGALKQSGTALWNTPNFGATNFSGFTALPAGNTGNYVGQTAVFHYNTGVTHYYFSLSYNTTTIQRSYASPYDYYRYFSVRCVKNK